jgi:hypothetical protein
MLVYGSHPWERASSCIAVHVVFENNDKLAPGLGGDAEIRMSDKWAMWEKVASPIFQAIR